MTRLFLSETADAYALLCQATRAVWGLDTLPRIDRSPHGKPYFPDQPGLHFNLSHSGSRAICALSSGAVGADVETIRPRRESLPRKTLSDREYRWFQDRGGRWEDFYTLWTLKEAKVKYQGTGLNRPVQTVSVPLLEPGQAGLWDGLHFTAYGGEGWRCALCSASDSALLEWFAFSYEA